MKTLFSIIVSLIVVSVICLWLISTEKINAEEPICTNCYVYCYQDWPDCFIAGIFCLDDEGGTPYFHYRQHDSGGWTRLSLMEYVTPGCDDGCAMYKLDPEPHAICGERYVCRVTWGTDVTKNIICEEVENGMGCPEQANDLKFILPGIVIFNQFIGLQFTENFKINKEI